MVDTRNNSILQFKGFTTMVSITTTGTFTAANGGRTMFANGGLSKYFIMAKIVQSLTRAV